MNTSARIRQYLEINGPTTGFQLCRAMDLTKADIYYHIRLLLKQGIIDVAPEPYQFGAGRPARQFILVKPAPESLSRLMIALLQTYHGDISNVTSNENALAEYLSTEILKNCSHIGEVPRSPALRLIRIIWELSTYGIHLRWLARKDGPFIYLEQEYLSTLIKDSELVELIIEGLLTKIKKMVA